MTRTTNTSRRWAAIVPSTGRILRTFASREAARNYKRSTSRSVALYDNVNYTVVR